MSAAATMMSKTPLRDFPRELAPAWLAGRHIYVVIAALGAGGAERVIAWLTAHWLDSGARVTILSFDSPSDPIYHSFPDKVRLRRLAIDARSRSLVPPAFRRIVALRRALADGEPDLVMSFLTKINVLTLAATVGMPVPVIVAERNNPERQPAHWLWKVALRRLYRRATAIVCQTQASTRCVPDSCRDQVRVIANPVMEPQAAGPVSETAHCITGVGRLEAQKGFDLLIDAFARIAGHYPGWTLDLWGIGPENHALRAQAQIHGIGGRVRLRGLSDHPGGWIAETGVFVLSSRYEGFPNVLGEAMAAGLPVIATDCAFGPAEMIDDGVNGLLVAAEDCGALADALDRMLRDAALRKRLAAAAPGVAEKFAPARVAAAWDDVLGSALDRPASPTQRSSLS